MHASPHQPALYEHASPSTLTGALVALRSNPPNDEAAVVAVGDAVVGVLVEMVVPEHLLKDKRVRVSGACGCETGAASSCLLTLALLRLDQSCVRIPLLINPCHCPFWRYWKLSITLMHCLGRH